MWISSCSFLRHALISCSVSLAGHGANKLFCSLAWRQAHENEADYQSALIEIGFAQLESDCQPWKGVWTPGTIDVDDGIIGHLGMPCGEESLARIKTVCNDLEEAIEELSG